MKLYMKMRHCALLALASFALVALAAADELKIDVVHKPESCEQQAANGDYVHVHYTGKLSDGTEFDSSIPRGEPIAFPLGAGRVISGWDQGVLGMCVGEKRVLTIPPELGYGDEGIGPIPGGATLVFDVELVSISDAPEGDDDPYAGAYEGAYGDEGVEEDEYLEEEGGEEGDAAWE